MDLNLTILGATLVLLAGVAAVRVSARAGLPSLLLYLLIGLVLGEAGLGLRFDDVDLTMLLSTLALAVILAEGGLSTRAAVIRPVVALLSLPLTILTLGLFSLVINAAMFGLTSLFSPLSIDGFWAAFWGAIIVALVSWFASSLVRDRT